MYHALATTAATSPSLPVKEGFSLLRKAPDSLRSDNSAGILLCVLSAKRFPRSFVESFKRVLFKIKNVDLICLVVLFGLGKC